MQEVLVDKLVKQASVLGDKERRELIEKLQKQASESESGYKKNPSPNIEWLKKNREKYAGNYVALKDGKFIAFGKTIKEADLKAKEKGVANPFLHYIPAKDEEVWGGW